MGSGTDEHGELGNITNATSNTFTPIDLGEIEDVYGDMYYTILKLKNGILKFTGSGEYNPINITEDKTSFVTIDGYKEIYVMNSLSFGLTNNNELYVCGKVTNVRGELQSTGFSATGEIPDWIPVPTFSDKEIESIIANRHTIITILTNGDIYEFHNRYVNDVDYISNDFVKLDKKVNIYDVFDYTNFIFKI
jgi:alpha-tubulin suppressor-like RCC1 family protein